MKRNSLLKIYKYQIPIEDRVELELPSGAEVLCVQSQGHELFLWAKVWTKNKNETRYFYVVGTGHPVPDDPYLRYVGTAQTNAGIFVWHVFEGGK